MNAYNTKATYMHSLQSKPSRAFDRALLRLCRDSATAFPAGQSRNFGHTCFGAHVSDKRKYSPRTLQADSFTNDTANERLARPAPAPDSQPLALATCASRGGVVEATSPLCRRHRMRPNQHIAPISSDTIASRATTVETRCGLGSSLPSFTQISFEGGGCWTTSARCA